jgi:hypothetical protein
MADKTPAGSDPAGSAALKKEMKSMDQPQDRPAAPTVPAPTPPAPPVKP